MNLTPETNERSDFALEWVCAAEPFRNAADAPAAPAANESSAADTPLLDHERLDVFRVALEFAAMVPALAKGARPAMRDQLERASSSIALMAQGSAMECAAALAPRAPTMMPASARRCKRRGQRLRRCRGYQRKAHARPPVCARRTE